MKDYHINVFYSDDDGCYVADIPDLRFCSAFGDSAVEAVREVQVAKKAWLKVAKQAGKPIPKPKYRPAIYQIVR
ncbi:MAG: type II toxin-antitoxin system HicB family antitoxin [Planctomycetes bacterium]|nr:type II toxin-antitoxin system HicB family antitoxin [Planctomycetota bacterium]